MDINKYKGVIQMVLKRHLGDSATAVTDDLLKSLEIAQVLSGEIPSFPSFTAQNIATAPSPTSQPKSQQITAPVASSSSTGILSFTPPVVGADEEGSDAEDIDYWETKPGKGDGCNKLQAALQKIMPRSISVQIDGLPQPLELVCGIGSPGIKFVHVSYTIAGDQLGPRYTLMTSIKPERLDRDAILADIAQQAKAMYSAEKRVIQPRPVTPIAPPSNMDLQKMMERDRQQQTPISQEDSKLAAEWAKSRSPNWQ